MHPRVALPGLMIAVAPALAQAETPKSTAPADFTAGLKQLAALGVPELPGAKWVSGESAFQMLIHGMYGMGHHDYQANEVLGSVASHGWLTPSGVMLPGRPVVLDPNKSASDNFFGDENMKEMFRKQRAEQLKKAPAADLAKDLDGLIKRLEHKSAEFRKQRAQSEGMGGYVDMQESAISGRMLVFAAQIYRAGDTASANRLAAAVFKNFPKRELALNAAISVIADTRYRSACEAFGKSGDWTGYATALKALQKEFPRGWENRPAVAKLIAAVEKRASGPAPAITLPAGVTGDAGTLAALAALGELKRAPSSTPEASSEEDSLWLLPAAPSKKNGGRMFFSGGSDAVMNAPEVKALTKSGFAALAALVAAVDDDSLTPFFRSDRSGSSFSTNESAESKTKRLYEALHRPMSRGEIARALLVRVIPGEEYKFVRMDTEAFAEAVETFRTEHAKSTPVELASLYLKDGSHQQKRAAMQYIAGSEDPAAGKVFEDSLLGSEDIEGRVSEGIEYLRAKRGKAAGFAQKLAAKLKENLALPDERPKGENSSHSSNGVTRLSAKYLERQIKEIETFASGKSPRELILAVAGKPAKDAMPVLNTQSQALNEMPLAERVPLMLEAACATTDSTVKAWCVGQIGGFRMYMGGESKEKYPLPAAGSVEAKRWVELIGDDKTKIQNNATVGLIAALAFESLFESPPPYAMASMFAPNGAKPDDLLQRRAKARLEGKEIPAYPDPAKVSAERLKAIVADVAATPDEKIENLIGALNPDERAAWGVWWSTHLWPESASYMKVTLPEVAAPETMLAREKRLSSLPAKSANGEDLSAGDKALTQSTLVAVGLKPGDVVDAARVEAVCAALAKNAVKHSGSILGINRAGWSLGMSFSAQKGKIAPVENPGSFGFRMSVSSDEMLAMQLLSYAQRFNMPGEYGYKGADAIVALMMPHSGNPRDRVWRVKDGKVEAPEALDAKAGETIPIQAHIVVLNAADAKIIRNDKASGTESDNEDSSGSAPVVEGFEPAGEE